MVSCLAYQSLGTISLKLPHCSHKLKSFRATSKWDCSVAVVISVYTHILRCSVTKLGLVSPSLAGYTPILPTHRYELREWC